MEYLTNSISKSNTTNSVWNTNFHNGMKSIQRLRYFNFRGYFKQKLKYTTCMKLLKTALKTNKKDHWFNLKHIVNFTNLHVPLITGSKLKTWKHYCAIQITGLIDIICSRIKVVQMKNKYVCGQQQMHCYILCPHKFTCNHIAKHEPYSLCKSAFNIATFIKQLN